MADQRQPFRFRLPWMPPTQATTTPSPAPAPRMPAPVAPRPPFRPGGVAPAQASPRGGPPPQPKASEPASPTKPGSPPKTEPPSKPVASTSSPRRIEPPSMPIATTSSPPRTEPPSKPIASTSSPPKTEPPSKPIATTSSPPETEPPSKPISTTSSPPRTEPPSKPIATTYSPPKTEPPSKPVAAISSPPKPSSPKSPSGSPEKPKHASPSSPFPSSPRQNALRKPLNSPKREPSPTPKHPISPKMADQGSSPKQEPERPQAQQQQTTLGSQIASELPHSPPEPTQKGVTSTSDNEEPKEEKRVIDESIIKQNGEPRKKLVATQPHERASHPKVSKPHNHTHKPLLEKAPLQKEIIQDISKLVNKLGNGQAQHSLDGEKKLTLITLAGENRGASMTLTHDSSKKASSIPIHRGYKPNPHEKIESLTHEEENSMDNEEDTTKACINSNVQGINNSLLVNGSVSTRDPGVKYVRCSSVKERRRDEEGRFEANRAEFSGTQSEIMAYAPSVRRCLRSLMTESGESDKEKARRHGCRYDSKEKKDEGDIDVV